MAKMEKYYDCEEIAAILCVLSSENSSVDVEIKKDVEETIYYLKALASNEYNAEHFRTFWNVLQKITDYHVE
ncbi:MAG: hypothetical protein MSG78_04135 [Clostridiales bacterium]|nr:hypothetical protein [Clostridiales bacterium]